MKTDCVCRECGSANADCRYHGLDASPHTLLNELFTIISTAFKRGNDPEHPECRVLLELPMTDQEYAKLKEIIALEDPKAIPQPPKDCYHLTFFRHGRGICTGCNRDRVLYQCKWKSRRFGSLFYDRYCRECKNKIIRGERV